MTAPGPSLSVMLLAAGGFDAEAFLAVGVVEGELDAVARCGSTFMLLLLSIVSVGLSLPFHRPPRT